MSLYYTIKIDRWSDFKSVVSTVKEIAEEVRKEYRRKQKTLVSMIAVRPIKAIISPLSLLMNHRYSDEAAFNLLSSAVRRIHCLALELESNYETRFVETLRSLASILVSFLSKYEGVQLELFDPNTYHTPFATRAVSTCFKEWLDRFDWRRFRQTLSAWKAQFTPVTFCQLSIKGLVIPASS
ncbi:hypothetical protein IQ255_07880 [Pleurocapsales cyanobacterium LEGE 10410]|nr:hypothetical protein [Pleurocapsales cyanobacterium LEGE 10410]